MIDYGTIESVLEARRAWAVVAGDSMDVMRSMPEESVHLVVTSPPYWTLRNYGIEGRIWQGPRELCERHSWKEVRAIRGSGGTDRNPERNRRRKIRPPSDVKSQTCNRCGAWKGVLGDEPDPKLFAYHLVLFFREVRRVLRSDGSCWVNLGDAYNGSGGSGGDYAKGGLREGQRKYGKKNSRELKRKDKALSPHEFALYAREPWLTCEHCGRENHRKLWWNPMGYADWYCPACLKPGEPKMTELGWWIRQDNVWDKPNSSLDSTMDRTGVAHEYVFHMTKAEKGNFFSPYGFLEQKADATDTLGKRVRSVWRMSPRTGGHNHHAAYPIELPERAIKLGTPERVCMECNAPIKPYYLNCVEGFNEDQVTLDRRLIASFKTCEHAGANTAPPIVLDPFLGTGTTLIASHMFDRRAIGIELSPDHAATAATRMSTVLPMFAQI